jgi:hypothetical protein
MKQKTLTIYNNPKSKRRDKYHLFGPSIYRGKEDNICQSIRDIKRGVIGNVLTKIART